MRAFVVLAATLLVAVSAPSCQDPSEVVLDINADNCSAIASVLVYVGGTSPNLDSGAPLAAAGGCDAGVAGANVGTLVIVPTAESAHLDIAVVASLAAGVDCAANPGNASCIVVRRSISFAPHKVVDLPIQLSTACAGTVCMPGYTCEVVSNEAHCVPVVCTNCDDGGAPDAVTVDAPDDVVAACVDPGPDPSQAPLFSWSFDNPPITPGSVFEDNNAVKEQPLVGTVVDDGKGPSCGAYLTVSNMAQTLAPADTRLTGSHMVYAMWYRAASGSLATVFQGGASLTAQFNGSDELTIVTASTFVHDGIATADGTWHYVVVDCDATQSLLKVARDGVPLPLTVHNLPSGYAAAGPLVVGPVVDVDQVKVWSLP